MPLHIVRKDITTMEVDAIVNTTNSEMIGYSGIDLLVHSKAGSALDEECKKHTPLGMGQAVITNGYNLPCRYVIHTSGPVWSGVESMRCDILKSCYTESLNLAVKYGLETVAVPLVSSGSYGYPKDFVLRFAIETVSEFLNKNDITVYICVWGNESHSFDRDLFSQITNYINADNRFVSASISRNINDSLPPISNSSSAPTSYPREAYRRNQSTASSHLPKRDASVPQEQNFACASSIEDEIDLKGYLDIKEKSFRSMLFSLIDERGITDVQCYKKANVDKRVFSKIKSNDAYKPSKQTAVAFAIALKLDLEKTQELLATLGYVLSQSLVFDKIIRFFIQRENYNIFEINEALFEFDQTLLGSA